MQDPSGREAVLALLRQIHLAWLEGRPHDLVHLLHPSFTMVFPGFTGRADRDEVIAGFVDFCDNALVHEYAETPAQLDVTGDTAVASFSYEMIYERAGRRQRATGRDLWVFSQSEGPWIAVWRTMLEVAEALI
jgi:hypothetical protein